MASPIALSERLTVEWLPVFPMRLPWTGLSLGDSIGGWFDELPAYTRNRQISSRFVARENVKAVRACLAKYKRLRKLTEKRIERPSAWSKKNANPKLDAQARTFHYQPII